jgi:hypothetical protein
MPAGTDLNDSSEFQESLVGTSRFALATCRGPKRTSASVLVALVASRGSGL